MKSSCEIVKKENATVNKRHLLHASSASCYKEDSTSTLSIERREAINALRDLNVQEAIRLRDTEGLNVDQGIILYLSTVNNSALAIEAGVLTVRDLVGMDRRIAHYLVQPACFKAIVEDNLFTIRQLIDIGAIKSSYITRPACIQAIRDERTTIEKLQKMSLDELANHHFSKSCLKNNASNVGIFAILSPTEEVQPSSSNTKKVRFVL